MLLKLRMSEGDSEINLLYFPVDVSVESYSVAESAS